MPNIYNGLICLNFTIGSPKRALKQDLKNEAEIMITKDQVCHTIRSVFPDVGKCGQDITTSYDLHRAAWVVDMKKDNRRLKTFVEPEDARACVLGEQCLGLGIQIHELRENIRKWPQRR